MQNGSFQQIPPGKQVLHNAVEDQQVLASGGLETRAFSRTPTAGNIRQQPNLKSRTGGLGLPKLEGGVAIKTKCTGISSDMAPRLGHRLRREIAPPHHRVGLGQVLRHLHQGIGLQTWGLKPQPTGQQAADRRSHGGTSGRQSDCAWRESFSHTTTHACSGLPGMVRQHGMEMRVIHDS